MDFPVIRVPLEFHAKEFLEDGTVGGDLAAGDVLLDWIWLPLPLVYDLVARKATQEAQSRAEE